MGVLSESLGVLTQRTLQGAHCGAESTHAHEHVQLSFVRKSLSLSLTHSDRERERERGTLCD